MRLTFIVTPVVLALGCTSSATTEHPPVAELDQGVNLLDVSDPTWGLTAAYVKGDQVVYLEQRVGALKPQLYRDSSPDEPPNEIDMRFVDKNGQTFFVERGGDTYIDPTWNADIAASFKNPAPIVERSADFALAQEAATEIAKALPNEFKALAYHPQVFASDPTPDTDPDLIGRTEEIEAMRTTTDEGYKDWYGGSTSWYLKGDLWDKKICYVWTCWARHSGIKMSAYNGSWAVVIKSCNHGSCPGSSSMTKRCTTESGVYRTGITLTGETSGSTGTISGGCMTRYDWYAGDNEHLCNDDSAYELWQIKNGKIGGNTHDVNGGPYTFVYTGAGTGGDGSWAHYACDCGDNDKCNNDWSRPICP